MVGPKEFVRFPKIFLLKNILLHFSEVEPTLLTTSSDSTVDAQWVSSCGVGVGTTVALPKVRDYQALTHRRRALVEKVVKSFVEREGCYYTMLAKC